MIEEEQEESKFVKNNESIIKILLDVFIIKGLGKVEFDKFLDFLKDFGDFPNIILNKETLKKEILKIERIEKYIRNIDDNYIYLNVLNSQKDQDEKKYDSYSEKKFSDLIKKNIMKKIKNRKLV